MYLSKLCVMGARCTVSVNSGGRLSNPSMVASRITVQIELSSRGKIYESRYHPKSSMLTQTANTINDRSHKGCIYSNCSSVYCRVNSIYHKSCVAAGSLLDSIRLHKHSCRLQCEVHLFIGQCIPVGP